MKSDVYVVEHFRGQDNLLSVISGKKSVRCCCGSCTKTLLERTPPASRTWASCRRVCAQSCAVFVFSGASSVLVVSGRDTRHQTCAARRRARERVVALRLAITFVNERKTICTQIRALCFCVVVLFCACKNPRTRFSKRRFWSAYTFTACFTVTRKL